MASNYGVGAVSCLAAAYGDTLHTINQTPSFTKGTEDTPENINIADSMDGSRIIASTYYCWRFTSLVGEG